MRSLFSHHTYQVFKVTARTSVNFPIDRLLLLKEKKHYKITINFKIFKVLYPPL